MWLSYKTLSREGSWEGVVPSKTRTFCEIVVSQCKIIHQVTVLFVIILSIIFRFVNRQNDKKITKIYQELVKMHFKSMCL